MARDAADDAAGANHDAADPSAPAIGTIIPLFPAAIPATGTLFRSIDEILKAHRPEDVDEALAERRRIIGLLTVFAEFILRSWNDPMRFEADHLLRESSAIFDQLGEGVPHPILTAAVRKGPPHIRIDVEGARECVCAALECLTRLTGKTREEIAKEIAGKYRSLKRLMRGVTRTSARGKSREQLKRAILSWHDRIQQGKAHEFMVRSWANVLNELAQPGAPLLDLSRRYLEMARNAAEKIALPSSP
jgi:hypothetical protein